MKCKAKMIFNGRQSEHSAQGEPEESKHQLRMFYRRQCKFSKNMNALFNHRFQNESIHIMLKTITILN